MIYELRTYVAAPGAIGRLHDRFAKCTLSIFARCGIEIVGFWAEASDPSRLIYVARFADEAARDAAWKQFAADAEWQRVKDASEREGPLVTTMTGVVLHPVEYFERAMQAVTA